uniref:mTERF domain-containing protein 1, mitochondrial n=1 Tax=Aegilops tauschii subsp. strangulata TaxID=200361 RepID=A0A453MQZ3_AEGTS
MLRLRSCCIVARLISPPSASSIPPLHRLLSTTVPVPANPGFAVEEYLVDTCGLTRAQALKASAKLSHLKSPAKPDAVLAFLAGLGLSAADVAALVARDPKFLCAGVETTLSPIVVELTGLGLSPSDIARLLTLAANTHFRNKSVVSKVGLLQECTLGVCDIGKLCTTLPRMLTANVEQIRAMVASAERLGVPRGSGMFRQALRSVAFLSEEKIAARTDYLKKTFRWSDAEVGIAV